MNLKKNNFHNMKDILKKNSKIRLLTSKNLIFKLKNEIKKK